MLKKANLVLVTLFVANGMCSDSLEYILQKAKNDSYVLKGYAEDKTSLRYKNKSINSTYYPSLTLQRLTTEQTKAGTSEKDKIIPKINTVTDLKLELNLYSGGKYEAQKKQNLFKIQQIDEDIKKEQKDLEFEINKNYYEKYIYNKVLKLEKIILNNYKIVLKHMQERARFGENISEESINSKKETLNNSVLNIAKYKNKINFSKLKLDNIFSEKMPIYSVSNDSISELIEDDFKNIDKMVSLNPEIKKIKLNLNELNAKLAEMKSKFMPQIDVMYKYSWFESKNEDSNSESKAYGLRVKIPFASEYISSSNLSLAVQSEIQKTKLNLFEKSNIIKENIFNTIYKSNQSFINSKNKQDKVKLKKAELDEYEIMKNNGDITPVKFLEKECEYLISKKAFMISNIEHRINMLSLNKLIYN